MTPSLGKQRRLQQASSVQGTFTVLAIDHRGPLRRRLAEQGLGNVEQSLVALKQDIVRVLAPGSTAVLLDPELGLEACVGSGTLPGSTGLLVALDTGSTGDPARLETGLAEGWDVERIARSGAAGVKLLVYYHPETREAETVEALVTRVAADCARCEIPLFLEPLSYDPADPRQHLPSDKRRLVVTETARRLCPLGVDVLKAEFPLRVDQDPDEAAWRDACLELSEACAGPWGLLSGGVPDDIFLRQVRVACESGASGVIAGRALWNEAVTLHGAARMDFLRKDASRRLEEVRSICDTAGKSWRAAFK